MKPKSFLILFILLLVLGSVTYFVLNREKPSSKSSGMGDLLLENFPLDDIVAVRISAFENDELHITNLKKTESGWVVEDLFEFPADFKSIMELVDKLKVSKIGRQFEASPDAISRLALHDPGQTDISQDEKAVRIQIFDPDQKSLADLLVGKQRESSTGFGAHYLKHTEENIVYLVDQSFWFEGKQPRNWIKTDLLAIPAEDIEAVTCINPKDQGIIYSVKRPAKGETPEFQSDVGDEAIKTRTVDLLFDSLSSLSIQDIAGPLEEVSQEKTGFDTIPYLDFQLFDGTHYRLYPGKKTDSEQGGYYVKIESEKLNHNLSQWVYIISDWEHQSLVTDLETFFEKSENNE